MQRPATAAVHATALIAAILGCIALRVAALPTLAIPRHDDVISYVAATGHMADYAAVAWEPRPPYGRLASAADWQRLWSLDDRFCFRRIAAGLGRYDIHPPLYFWLLHLWMVVLGGVTVYSGPTVNLLLAAGAMYFVYRLARDVSGSAWAALVAALIWGGSRATLGVTLAARQYELLGLLTAAFLWRLARATDPARTPSQRELVGSAPSPVPRCPCTITSRCCSWEAPPRRGGACPAHVSAKS